MSDDVMNAHGLALFQFVRNVFLRRTIILAWNRSFWAIINGVTLACNSLIAFSRSTCVRFCIVNLQCVTFKFKVLNVSSKLDIRLVILVVITCVKLNKMN